MKLLQYLFAVFTFSIFAVSFEFSDKHDDYVKSIKPQDRTFIVLGLLALEGEYGDSTGYDPSTLSINYKHFNDLVLKTANKIQESQFESFPEAIHDLYEHFFSTFPENFWNLEFEQIPAMEVFIKKEINTRCLYNYDRVDKNLPFIMHCFNMTLKIDSIQLFMLPIDFPDSLSALMVRRIVDVSESSINKFLNIGEKINCEEVKMSVDALGFKKSTNATIEKDIENIENFLSKLHGLKILHIDICDMLRLNVNHNVIRSKLHEFCAANNVEYSGYDRYSKYVEDAYYDRDSFREEDYDHDDWEYA